jgi:hypothetical protein
LSLDEVTRLMQNRALGLPAVGQMVNALPENLRNPVAATITTLAGVPFSIADLPHLVARGIDWSTDQLNQLAGITTPEYRTNLAAHVPPSGSVMAQDFIRRLGLEPTIADTATGRIAQGALAGTVGGALLGGGTGAVYRGAGAVPTATRGAQLGLASGMGSEIAGEATRGTPYETSARLIAGLLLPTAAALEQSRVGGTMRIMGRAVDDATPAQLRQAHQLLADAEAGGHPLTVPEALAQAGIPGATRLLIMQRLAEQQGAGAGQTFNTFRQYQAQNAERAINDVANQVAPPIRTTARPDVVVSVDAI